MSQHGGDEQAPPSGGVTTTDVSIGPLADHLADGETVAHRLEGSNLEFVEQAGERHAPPPSDPIAVATDRRVYFAALAEGGLDTAEIRYRNVRDVEATGGLLRGRLELRVWGEGTYRFKPKRGEPTAEMVEFVERASAVWQRVLAATETAREAITDHGRHVTAGETVAASEARRTIREELDTARERIDEGQDDLADALEARIDDVETELQRTQVHTHVKRCKTLYEAAEERADAEAWADAEAALRESFRHVEIARKIASLAGFPVVDAIEQEYGVLRERAADIASRPRKLGGLAAVTAREAEQPEAAVPAWASALDHYRAAVSFDWGGRLGVERDTDALREQIEEAAEGLIAARCEFAANLRDQAVEARRAGETARAADHYEVARSQLSMAESVAGELRAGDPAEIAAEKAVIQRRLDALDAGTATEEVDADRQTVPEKPV